MELRDRIKNAITDNTRIWKRENGTYLSGVEDSEVNMVELTNAILDAVIASLPPKYSNNEPYFKGCNHQIAQISGMLERSKEQPNE